MTVVGCGFLCSFLGSLGLILDGLQCSGVGQQKLQFSLEVVHLALILAPDVVLDCYLNWHSGLPCRVH